MFLLLHTLPQPLQATDRLTTQHRCLRSRQYQHWHLEISTYTSGPSTIHLLATHTTLSNLIAKGANPHWLDFHADQLDASNRPHINAWPTFSSTATSHTKTSLISGNTPMSSGMKPPSNTISSNTTQSHYLTLTPKPPEHHHHPFPAPPPLTGKLPTSTPDTPALSATSLTFYDKAVSYPAHATFQTIPDSLLKASALPTTNNTTTANLPALSTIPGNSTKTPTPSSSHSWHGAPPRNTPLAAKSRL